MNQKSYNSLENLVYKMKEKVLYLLDNLEKNGMDYEVIALIQQTIIDFGSEIEEIFHLQGASLLVNFEECCELCYQFTQLDDNRGVLEKLRRNIFKWPESLKQSVKIEDRKLSIVLIIRDEGAYIEEWLEYHFMMGISHVYIYDNESKDDTKQKLSRYIENGKVTYIWWPGQYVQMKAYDHAVEHYKYETEYMGFIDADEFLVATEDMDLSIWVDEVFELCDRRLSIYGPYQCGGIGINYKVYGTSHHKSKPDGLVIQNYKYRANESEVLNFYIKTICNPRTVQSCKIHHMCYIEGYYCTSQNGSIIPGVLFFDGVNHKVRINHYITKSEEEYVQRERKGKAVDHGVTVTEEDIQSALPRIRNSYNDIYDPMDEKYISAVRKRLEQCRSFNS